ncbi:MAG: hypothetical protein QOD82_373 [Pseudonocardiales bacterium]|nr:hypothetical protein [Pseudonocardiales bacterium]
MDNTSGTSRLEALYERSLTKGHVWFAIVLAATVLAVARIVKPQPRSEPDDSYSAAADWHSFGTRDGKR